MRVAALYVALFLFGNTWSWLVPTVAEGVLGLPPPSPSGSGDTSWHYVHLCVDLSLATAGATVWSVLFRGARTVQPLCSFAIRAYLFNGMTAYGLMKVFRTQFPEPSLIKLTTTFGESSSMGVLWAFMGASAPYSVFTGLIELVGAALMVSRRTTTLGALILLGAMGNVVMLNLCYDVPVKQHSIHYLVGALVLVGSDWRRLANAFILHRDQAAPVLLSIFETPRLHRLGSSAKALAAGGLLLSGVASVVQMRARFFDIEPPPVYGIWEVAGFEDGGESAPRWTQLVVAKRGRAAVRVETGQRWAYRAKSVGGTLELEPRREGDPAFELEYMLSEPDDLTLNGDGIVVRLKRVDETDLPLRNREFHWITEGSRHRWK